MTLIISGCAESIISVRSSMVNDDILDDYDIYTYYSLPRTELKIKIPIAQYSIEKGILSYEEEGSQLIKLLEYRYGWKPVEPPEYKYAVDQNITFEAVTLPDPEKRYAIAYKNSKMISATLNATLTRDGLIQSGEFAQESKAFEVAVKAMEIFGPVISAAASLGGVEDVNKEFSTVLDIDSLSGRIKRLLQNAEELYAYRSQLISKPTNSVNNVEIIKYHLGEIDKQLIAIKNELLGSVSKTIHYVTIVFDPEKHFEELDLLEIDPQNGILRKNNLELIKLSEDLTTDKALNETISLKLLAKKIIEPGIIEDEGTSIEVINDGDKTTRTLNTKVFMYYNIPAKYELKLMANNKPLKSYTGRTDKNGSDEYQIYFPQLGKVAFLNKDFKEANIIYYEDIGALKSAKISKSAEVDAEKVESMYSALDSMYSTIQEIRKKDDTDQGDASVTEEVNEQVIRLFISEENPDQ
jgi:hypothetical protein